MMKNLMKYILIIAVVCVMLGITILVYSFSNNKNELYINDKIKQEVSYLDERLLSTINSLNNLDTEYSITNREIFVSNPNKDSVKSSDSKIGQSENKTEENSGTSESSILNSENENKENDKVKITSIHSQSILSRDRNDIDWEYIQNVLEEINNSWNIITIDLKSVDVANDELLKFSNDLDAAMKSAREKDKNNSIINIANLYNMLPIYEKSCTDDIKRIELKYIQSDIVSSYALLNSERWTEMLPLLNDAEQRITKIIDFGDNYNLQKIYVELKEYIKSVNDMDVDLCYLKYYYLINDLKKEN